MLAEIALGRLIAAPLSAALEQQLLVVAKEYGLSHKVVRALAQHLGNNCASIVAQVIVEGEQ